MEKPFEFLVVFTFLCFLDSNGVFYFLKVAWHHQSLILQHLIEKNNNDVFKSSSNQTDNNGTKSSESAKPQTSQNLKRSFCVVCARVSSAIHNKGHLK